MMTRLYEQREPVGAAVVSLCTDLAALTSAEYPSISECLGALSPLKEATVELSAVSGSKIVPFVRKLSHAVTSEQRKVNGDSQSTLPGHAPGSTIQNDGVLQFREFLKCYKKAHGRMFFSFKRQHSI